MAATKIETVLNADNKIIPNQFHALTIKELRALQAAKVLHNAGYVYLYLKCLNPFNDKKLTFSSKQLAFELGIPESSLSDALNRLKAEGLIKITNNFFSVELVLAENSESRCQQQSVNGNPYNGEYTNNKRQSEKPYSKTESRTAKRNPVSQNGIPNSETPKPAPETDRERSKTIQTNKDFLDSKSEQENLEDFWLDDEETNTKIDEFKQEQTSQLVEAEIIDQQTETVSTSDKETTTAIVANQNLSQGEVYSACSTFEAKFKHRAANPKQTNMDRLQEALNWVPEGVWCTEPGKLDPEFLKWSVSWWMGKFDCKDEYDAKGNVLAYYKNDLSKLVIRWEQYSNTYLAKYKNADLRLSHGCTVGEKEEKELKDNVRAVTKQLPTEMSYEGKQLQQNTNSVASLPEVQQNRTLVESIPNQNPIAQEKQESDREPIYRKYSHNDNSIAELPTELPKDEFGAVNNAEAYKPWQPKKEDNLATPEQIQALKAKIAKFKSNFGKGLTEKRDKRLEKTKTTLDRLNLDLADPILRDSVAIKAKSLGYDLILDENGKAIGAELPF